VRHGRYERDKGEKDKGRGSEVENNIDRGERDINYCTYKCSSRSRNNDKAWFLGGVEVGKQFTNKFLRGGASSCINNKRGSLVRGSITEVDLVTR